jgi:hypothetical protein
MISAFPKVFALGHRHVRDIFDGKVEITEKVDGSQIAFGMIDGKLYVRSRGAMINLDAPDSLFREGVEYIKSNSDKLAKGVTYYGEYLKKPKHNTLAYERIPKNHIALFGVCHPEMGFLEFHDILHMTANELDMDVVPLLGYADNIRPEDAIKLIDDESFLGGTSMEGIVVKNYDMERWVGGVLFPIMSAKFVSEKFKEKHQKDWKQNKTSPGQMQQLVESLRTEARWRKAVQHLREAGAFEPDPKMIGSLLKEINQDLIDEDLDYIKDFLWKVHKRQILKGVTSGFPEWFKEQLAKGEFDG